MNGINLLSVHALKLASYILNFCFKQVAMLTKMCYFVKSYLLHSLYIKLCLCVVKAMHDYDGELFGDPVNPQGCTTGPVGF